MNKLSFYLLKQYVIEAVSLFLVIVFLVWITQALRLFDLVTAKGQDILTLAGQAFLTTPPLSRSILAITMGIAISRTMRALQTSRELHTIHATGRTRAMWGSFIWFALAGGIAVALIANWIEPIARKGYANWSEQIAADLVGRTLNPNQFREIAPGFVVEIGGRLPDGTILSFFAHDARDAETIRTYQAKTATISTSDDGYNLNLRDGSLQILKQGTDFSEIKFNGYELALDNITQTADRRNLDDETTTFEFLFSQEALTAPQKEAVDRRFAETFRVFALCLFVAALTAFPHARRKANIVPLEMITIIVAISDRVVSDAAPLPLFGNSTGAVYVGILGISILLPRLYGYLLPFGRTTKAKA